MSLMKNDKLGFEIAQALRESHCDRKDEDGHVCVGEMAVKRGKICLSCELCGKGDLIPGWSELSAIRLDFIFRAAGINWDSLSLEAKIAAIKAYEVRQ